jgi:hypothetical protein
MIGAVGYNLGGTEEIYALGTGGEVFHAWFDAATGWSNWASLGGSNFTSVSVGYNSLGAQELFAFGSTGSVSHNYYSVSRGWSGWASLGGSKLAP